MESPFSAILAFYANISHSITIFKQYCYFIKRIVSECNIDTILDAKKTNIRFNGLLLGILNTSNIIMKK